MVSQGIPRHRTTVLRPVATVVAVHQYHVALGVNQQGAEGAARAVGGLSESKALLNADGQVLVLHGLTIPLGRVPAFQSFATMAKVSSSSAPSACSTLP